jgi:hypothetical protein
VRVTSRERYVTPGREGPSKDIGPSHLWTVEIRGASQSPGTRKLDFRPAFIAQHHTVQGQFSGRASSRARASPHTLGGGRWKSGSHAVPSGGRKTTHLAQAGTGTFFSENQGEGNKAQDKGCSGTRCISCLVSSREFLSPPLGYYPTLWTGARLSGLWTLWTSLRPPLHDLRWLTEGTLGRE